MEGGEQNNLIDPNSILALGRPTFGSPLGILGIRFACSKRHTVVSPRRTNGHIIWGMHNNAVVDYFLTVTPGTRNIERNILLPKVPNWSILELGSGSGILCITLHFPLL
ncbi:hypothetical protein PCH_Pc20g02890 [Penicillium rubens Wisconsin 54-1255]|uniref:Uncharacterized protein n=1 Tax=Penicillium rubens (strain ATCC 28089 / DSM 1075 / NRRL 1951 / Wisconsin 54-1255) TaxID=500485 RepID=B6HF50_PENRW|nr:hypothetical protein PCH_Pc20g02890 [Penicillium rubens Wisconsin 54-1255]